MRINHSNLGTLTFLVLLVTGFFPVYVASEKGIKINTNKKVLNWANNHPFIYSNSPTAVSAYSSDYLSSIYNGLLKRTIASDREYVPDLAAAMPIISKNNTVWTFMLKSGLKFSDDSDLNASSVVFSYRVSLTSSINSGAGDLALYFPTNSSIWEVDNLTIRFNMSQPYAFALGLFSQWIYSENHFGPQYDACLADSTLAACNWKNHRTGGHLQGGSGAFMMDKYDESNFIELVPNPNYYNANQIKLDRINIKSISDVNVAKAAFISGEINVFDSNYKAKAADFANLVGVTDVLVDGHGTQEMVVNHNHQYFGLGNYSTPARDEVGTEAYTLGANQTYARNIRKAMSHMIDRVFIADEIAGGLGSPAATIMPKIATGWDETILTPEYDVDVAKTYMEDAGFDYTAKTYDPDTGAMNEPFFEITVISPWGIIERENWAALMAQELPKIGVGVKAHFTGGPSSYTQKYRVYGHPVPPPDYDHGGYDIAFLGWGFGLDFNPVGLYELESQNPNCCNFYNYNNITTENAIADYVKEPDAAARFPLVKYVQELLYDDLPSIPIINSVDHWAWSNQIIGLDGLSMSQRFFEWELVDIDFTISGVTSISIPTEFITITESVSASIINDDYETSLIEETTKSVNLSIIKFYITISTLYVIVLIKKKINIE